ncbi:osteocrin-like [Microcaecilia unicolor]|uniref:Osteocrin-like n=1 Tax=Microcaecilia unicolor TaxID=1415580 RepID=A0A6P7ZBA4_9AMPH|nr:osteocrin-like [Microcaecilia unicolor]
MLGCHLAILNVIFALALTQWSVNRALLADAAPQSFDPSIVLDMESQSLTSEEKLASDLATKLLLLDELVSLENDVMETKKKRSFSSFGSPLDRLSVGSTELRGKQRKVVELPKRRFGVLPLDRIGMNRLSNSRG